MAVGSVLSRWVSLLLVSVAVMLSVAGLWRWHPVGLGAGGLDDIAGVQEAQASGADDGGLDEADVAEEVVDCALVPFSRPVAAAPHDGFRLHATPYLLSAVDSPIELSTRPPV